VYAEDVNQAIKRDIGTRIRRQREAAGFSQRDFARRLEVDQREISRWETGRVKPEGPALARIAEALGVHWTLLAYGTSRPNGDDA
jgi:transcriptional regulator with XRE-family HTH domain